MSMPAQGFAWHVRRLGVVMEPSPDDPHEVEGVYNPAVTRGPDGQLYVLPRLVAAGNYSRIGLARVLFDRRGGPCAVERLGIALAPEQPYELNDEGGGGVEDPRVTFLRPLGLYVMTYTAFGPDGPRVAAAVSHDVAHWQRTGLIRFAPFHGIEMGAQDNKDAVLFPEAIVAPDGRAALALLHRPTFREPPSPDDLPPQGTLLARERPGIWISYAPLAEIADRRRVIFGQHHRLAAPVQAWESLKLGAGTPPVHFAGGWLVLYHGVSGVIQPAVAHQQHVRYSAGMLLLGEQDPKRVLYRSPTPLLAPRTATERVGTVPGVIFPTGVDARSASTLDVYYGMADSRIGAARIQLTTPPACRRRAA